MKANNDPIALSGRVFGNGFIARMRGRLTLPKKLQIGDVKVYNRPDRKAMGSGRSNGGGGYFPGILQLSVWNGTAWRNLTVRLRIAETQRKHGTCADMLTQIDRIIARVPTWRTELVFWTAHTFYLPAEVAPQEEPSQPAKQSAPAPVAAQSQSKAGRRSGVQLELF